MTKKGNPYKRQAKLMLEYTFPRISSAAIAAVLNHAEFDFPVAFRVVSVIGASFPNEDNAKMACLPLILPASIRVFLKHDRQKKKPSIRDEHLKAAMASIPEFHAKENNPPPTIVVIDNNDDDDDDDDDFYFKKDLDIECGCCYGDYPQSEMKQCSANNGHQVCTECLQRFVSEQLDGNGSTQFKCIVEQECTSVYAISLLDQVLSPRLNKRVNDRVFREDVKQSGLPIWECPECAYIGAKDEGYPTIKCGGCKKYYCVSCNDLKHKGKTCEEARREKARLQDPVHRAYEAMSKAVTRKCPTCQREFVKRDGCNKMKCTCKALSCYLCGVHIEDYSHFCNHKKPKNGGTCPCGKSCKLWTNTEKMERLDRKARRKAGK